MTTPLNKGDFIKMHTDIGIIVYLEGENNTPEEHIGVWYGESSDTGKPLYKIVPMSYCKKVDDIEHYH